MNKDKVLKKIKELKIETKAFINGEYVNAVDNKTINKISPINGENLPSLTACNDKDINNAVLIARETYENRIWVDLSPIEKQKIILKLADLIEENLEDLALMDTIETGRSLKNYLYDSLPKAIESMRWFANAIDKYYDFCIPVRKDAFSTITKEPLGVVGIITPWNDPLVVDFWKITPALLMGNSIVIKPAEQSSYSILKVAKLAIDAGVPKGVFNVVPGLGEEAGKSLALHNQVDGIFFTGSSFVGKKILQYSGMSNMKKVGLECGGKSPFIVTKNYENLEKVAVTLAKNLFYNQGQICSAPSRLIIHKDIKDKFLELLLNESKKYEPNDPLDINTEVGAVINKEQYDKIIQYISIGKKEGNKIITSEDVVVPYEKGFYVKPVIFDNVHPNSRIAQEEIFGPVLAVIEYENIKEAVMIANNSKYGLAASVWTNDLNESYYVSRVLNAGIVHINSYGEDDNRVPFGGIKESGLGKDKSLYAFDEYSNTKTIWICYEEV